MSFSYAQGYIPSSQHAFQILHSHLQAHLINSMHMFELPGNKKLSLGFGQYALLQKKLRNAILSHHFALSNSAVLLYL